MSKNVTERDLELLRTVTRLQLVKTTLLQGFFPTPRMTRRRMARLRELGLVASHNRGLPTGGAVGIAAYWRLTEAGLALVERAFPDEVLTSNVVQRARNASLRFWEHRDRIASLYLSVILAGGASRARAAASAFRWASENSVVLRYQRGSKAHKIVPDATMATSATRFFLEVDRSTESRARCRKAVAAYAQFCAHHYEGHFGDGLAPYVVYVTETEHRARSLRTALRGAHGAELQVVVLTVREATGWLTTALLGADFEAQPQPLPSATPSPPVRALRALYEDFYAVLHAQEAAGAKVDWPASLRDAHNILISAEPSGV